MTIPPEVAAAAERLKRYYDTRRTNDRAMAEIWPMEHDHDLEPAEMRDIDRRTLADFALSVIATQQQEAAERGKPIDEEWLNLRFAHYLVLGWALKREVDCGSVIDWHINAAEDRSCYQIWVTDGNSAPVPIVTLSTRCELLDLLTALKIQVKGSEQCNQ